MQGKVIEGGEKKQKEVSFKSFFPQKSKRIIELRPDEKKGFIQGGYGSLRVAPKIINNELQYFLCASSTGVSHEGINCYIKERTLQ